jgi:hypothetical protein
LKFPKADKFDLLIIAITIGMYLLVISLSFSSKPLGDLDFYLESKTLAGYAKGFEPLENVGLTKAPGPIIYYFIPYLFVPYHSSEHTYWLVGVLWTCAFMLISMLMFRRAGRNLFNDLTGRIACILSIIFPLHLYYSFSIAAESLGYIGSICMLYGFSVWYRNGYETWYRSRGWWLFFAGMTAMLTAKPTMFLILPLAALVLGVSWLAGNVTIRRIIKPTLLMIAFTAIAFFSLINIAQKFPGKRDTFRQSEYLVHISHLGRFQFRTEHFDWRFWDGDSRKGSADYQMWIAARKEINTRPGNYKKSLKEKFLPWIIDDIKENKLLFLKQFAIRAVNGQFLFVNSLTPEGFKMFGFKGPLAYYIFHIILNSINIIILISAIIFLFRERKRLAELWVLWVTLAAILLFHASVYMEPRYMFSGRACMLLMAAFIMSRYIAKFRNPLRNKKQQAASLHNLPCTNGG